MLREFQYYPGAITKYNDILTEQEYGRRFLHISRDKIVLKSTTKYCKNKACITMIIPDDVYLEEAKLDIYCILIYDDGTKWFFNSMINNKHITTHMLVYSNLTQRHYKYVNVRNINTNSVVFIGKITIGLVPYLDNYNKIRFDQNDSVDLEIFEQIQGRLFGYDCPKVVHGPEYFPYFAPAEGLNIGISHANVPEFGRWLMQNRNMYYLELNSTDLTSNDLIMLLGCCPNLVSFAITDLNLNFDNAVFNHLPSSLLFLELHLNMTIDITPVMVAPNKIKHFIGSISYDNDVLRRTPRIKMIIPN